MSRRARAWWIPAIALAVGVLAVLGARWDAEPTAAPASEGEREPQAIPDARRPTAAAPVARPPTPAHAQDAPPPAPDTELPLEGRVYFPGQGWATVVPTDPSQAPAPVDESQLPGDSPQLPPEQPQTPEWREAKAQVAEGMVRAKLSAAQKELEQARASGDADRLRRAEAALARQRALLEMVRGEQAAPVTP